MAEITTLSVSGGQGNPQKREYFLETVVDFAQAASDNGTALLANDTINALSIPEGSVVLFAGMQVDTVATGGTGTILDLGVKGGDTDAFVDGFDFDAATADSYAVMANTAAPIVFGSAGTLDILIQAATTVATAGKVRVFARILDVSEIGGPIQADAADRDQLA